MARNLRKALPVIRVVIWIAAIVVCSYFMIYQTKECLSKLFHPPLITTTKMKLYDNMAYPAVTFCYKNSDEQGYDNVVLERLNISYWILNDGYYIVSPWKRFSFDVYNLTHLWEESTFMFNRYTHFNQDAREKEKDVLLLPRPTINVVTASLNLDASAAVAFSQNFYHDHGRCATFKPSSPPTEPLPGERWGYKFYFWCLSYHPNSTMLPGSWDVFVHDPDEHWAENPRLSSRGEHLHIDSGKVAYIKLDRNVLTTKNRSESPCQSTRSEQTYNDCLERCRWNNIAVESNCNLPFMRVASFNECDTYEAAMTAMDRYRHWSDSTYVGKCNESCMASKRCITRLYKFKLMRLMDNSAPGSSYFHIYFPTGISVELEEEWGYDQTMFIADFGGSLGFLLGISILSVLEIIESAALALYRYLRACLPRYKTSQMRSNDDGDETITIESERL